MKSKTEIKLGCCAPESEIQPSHVSRALATNLSSSTSSTPHSPLLSLSNEERKAIEAHKLQVEQRRSMAITLARRNTYI